MNTEFRSLRSSLAMLSATGAAEMTGESVAAKEGGREMDILIGCE